MNEGLNYGRLERCLSTMEQEMGTSSQSKQNASQARVLIAQGKYDDAINLLEEEIKVRREGAIFNLFWCYYKKRDTKKIAELLSQNINLSSKSPGFRKELADSHYLAAVNFLFPSSSLKKIANYSREPKTDADISSLVEELVASEKNVLSYVENRANVFRVRYSDEYKLIAWLPIDLFPYKYLRDYRVFCNECSASPTKKISLDFIYCIKNRSQRTLISIISLLNSCKAYTSSIQAAVEPRIVVVEDESTGLFDANWLITEASRRGVHASYFLTRTGISWTRSGLLNIGIKRSTADLVAFVDSDFLFHETFISSLNNVFLKAPVYETFFAVNSVETESHKKAGVTYSIASPYAYMWIAPTYAAQNVNGFDENYIGHGFEDRDMEMKLTKILGLTVRDSLSYDPDCFVLHLSHNVRDGADNRQANQKLYLQRASEKVLDSLVQPQWGEYPLVAKLDSNKHELKTGMNVDFLFVPHNRYHAKSFLTLTEGLIKSGFSSRMLRVSPPYPNEGAYIEEYAPVYVTIKQLYDGDVRPRVIVCMNDWEKRLSRPLIEAANKSHIKTVAIVEGVNDFFDVDTRLSRSAYRRVHHVLLNGDFDRRYFERTDQVLYTAGILRLGGLWPYRQKRKLSEKVRRLIPVVVANVNFTYGVLEEHRETWLASIKSVCDALNYRLIVSLHHADKANLFGYDVSPEPLYDLLVKADFFVTRFSGAVLEALVIGTRCVYFNPGIEKIDKFCEPLGAFTYCCTESQLVYALTAQLDQPAANPREFLKLHGFVNALSEFGLTETILRTTEILTEIAREEIKTPPDFSEMKRQVQDAYKTLLPAPTYTLPESSNRKKRDKKKVTNLFLVISCQPYSARRDALEIYYRRFLGDTDDFVFVIGGAKETSYQPDNKLLHLAAGDLYEDLPEKVLDGIIFALNEFDFENLIKVDDDVMVNFEVLRQTFSSSFGNYFGKMVPSKRGAKPSPDWHFGKVTEKSKFFQKKFEIIGAPENWACGGMYGLSYKAAVEIGRICNQYKANDYLYEDHFIGHLLHQAGIYPTFIDEMPELAGFKWIVTDLREVLEPSFEGLKSATDISKIVAFHCGPYPPFYAVDSKRLFDLFTLISDSIFCFNDDKSVSSDPLRY